MAIPTLDLFAPKVPSDRFHPIFSMLLQSEYEPERAVLRAWSEGFHDRDGKFVQEFQTTFESSLWELYLHACLRALKLTLDMSFSAPDFVVTRPIEMIVEATIAAPPQGGKPAFNWSAADIPSDFGEFNSQATLRICNSFDSKVKKHRERYSSLPQAKDKPYVIAIGAFDRPLAHMAAGRPALAAVYGLYHDEELTISTKSKSMLSYNVEAAMKNKKTEIPVGFFCTEEYADVSVVIYSALATWGKIRALANSPEAKTVYTTIHPNPAGLSGIVKKALKKDYVEHLLDGLFVLHNPFATKPIQREVFAHPRLAQCRVASDGELLFEVPDDFLLVRQLNSFVEKQPPKNGEVV